MSTVVISVASGKVLGTPTQRLLESVLEVAHPCARRVPGTDMWDFVPPRAEAYYLSRGVEVRAVYLAAYTDLGDNTPTREYAQPHPGVAWPAQS